MSKSAVILLSGGLDSTTAAYIARKDIGKTGKLYPLSVMYGQRAAYELTCAERIAHLLGAELQLAAVGLISICNSSLISGDVPDYDPSIEIPSTWVPQRNTMFITLGYAYAETVGADLIYTGILKASYSPDTSEQYLKSIESACNLASKRFVSEGRGFGLVNPLHDLSKPDIIKKGLELNIDYAGTWTCYKQPNSKGEACGKCHSCVTRLNAFKEAGIPDPLKYAGEGS